jgi:nucleoid-associated protein YgaU
MTLLAEKYYGDKRKSDVISKANPLVDPRAMKIGTKLVIPAAPSASPAKVPTTPAIAPATAANGEKTHVVMAGDTLAGLARTYFGDATMAPYIYETNKALIGSDPDALKVGMKLVIPKKP